MTYKTTGRISAKLRAMSPPILISNLTNVRYLTGLSMSAGVILMTGRKIVLFVDDRYLEKAEKVRKEDKVDKVEVMHIRKLTKVIKKYKQVRFEADDLTVARFARWKKRFKGTRLIPSTGVIEEMRRVKSEKEIKAIRKACRITDKVLQSIPQLLSSTRRAAIHGGSRNVLTEKQLAWKIEKLSRELGADELAFDTIVAFGENTSEPHHEPGNRKLKRGDIVQIDMGVKVDGYCSDCSRVFFTGKPSEKQKSVYDLLVNIVKDATKLAKSGTTNHKLDKFARDSIKKAGYGECFTHGLGHGVGLYIHEDPRISPRGPRQTLKTGEVITIEPGIYITGQFGMRIENTVLLGNKSGKALTTNSTRRRI